MTKGVAVAFMLLACAAVAPAQQPGLSAGNEPSIVSVKAGYANSVRDDGWAPLFATVHNPGPDVTVEVITTSEDAAGRPCPLVARARLFLPAHSTRRHTLYAHMQQVARLHLELRADGLLVDRRDVETNPVGSRRTFILALSGAEGEFNCSQMTEETGPSWRLVFRNFSFAGDFPTRRQGLDSADVILLGPLPAEGFTAVQEEAIAQWVRGGGLLILAPGGRESRYAGTVFESLCPVTVLGERKVAALHPFAEAYGGMKDGERIGLTEGMPAEGARTLMQMGEFPLLVTRREGAGMVVFAAFDLTADRVVKMPGLKSFYMSLIEAQNVLPGGVGNRQVAREAGAMLYKAVGVRVLPRWALGAFLATYMALVAGLLLGLRKHREWAFLILVVAGPAFAGVIKHFGAAVSGVEQNSLAGVAVLRSAAGSALADATSYHAMLIPGSAVCDVDFPAEAWAFPRTPIAGAGSSAGREGAETLREPTDLMDADLKSLHALKARPRELEDFEATSVARLPGAIDVTARAESDGIHVEVANHSALPFTGGFAAFNRNAVILGDLSPGAATSVILDRATAVAAMSAFEPTVLLSAEELDRSHIVRALYTRQAGAGLENTGLVVAGWTSGMPVEADVRAADSAGLSPLPDLRRSGSGLWLVGTDLTAHGEALLPKGSPALRLPQAGALMENDRWKPVTVRRVIEAAFGVPMELRGLKPRRIEFFLRLSGAPANALIEAFNCETQQYEPIHGSAGGGLAPLERFSFLLNEPARFLPAQADSVKLRVTLQPAAGLPGGAVSQAQIEDFDLEIEGTME